ncbi:Uncharacterised protein [Chlamydia abortus]|uniref:Uncharacterized protein n=1 Tax=Paenibacillus residui TaxID=629724 RepID=A0ABW3D8P4_9BACL|nr:hypothetical protein [Paenibacillus sp. 32O-W]SHE14227.1 Uncharacterised protein [Chlamydia abortus]
MPDNRQAERMQDERQSDSGKKQPGKSPEGKRRIHSEKVRYANADRIYD